MNYIFIFVHRSNHYHLFLNALSDTAANPSAGVLAGAVEACLSQGLKRRALGLFKTSSTTALLHKVAKIFEPAAIISRKIQEIENSDPNRYEHIF
jgi:hypothetical protein